MTGFGAAVCQEGDLTVSVELKAVNNRYFKLSLRMTDGYSVLESRIEPLLRSVIDRGTINANVRIQGEQKDTDFKINAAVLQSYAKQLTETAVLLGQTGYVPSLDKLVFLPGIVKTGSDNSGENEAAGLLLDRTMREALNALQAMRKTEGDSMTKDLTANVESLRLQVEKIEELTPRVAPLYRQKLKERIEKALAEQSLALNDSDFLRELAVYADRCDVSEETVRFRSHLEQFTSAMQSKESCGRKLDFLTQELFREANTIGSKANDSDMTKHVVEIKTVIERIREMVQNIE